MKMNYYFQYKHFIVLVFYYSNKFLQTQIIYRSKQLQTYCDFILLFSKLRRLKNLDNDDEYLS